MTNSRNASGLSPSDRWVLRVILILLCPVVLVLPFQESDLVMALLRIPLGLFLGWAIVKWLDSRAF